ncbi:MAG: hypothetical protein JXQ71_07475 [Verrucomicrobia bacterium]|nr:hypothetical protein [Verrucomicrobiota bacterium]
MTVPLALPCAALERRQRGQSPQRIDKVILQSPARFLSQRPKFKTPA